MPTPGISNNSTNPGNQTIKRNYFNIIRQQRQRNLSPLDKSHHLGLNETWRKHTQNYEYKYIESEKGKKGILAEGGCHLVGERTGDDHAVRLSRTGAKDDAEAVQIVAGGAGVHHFHSAASETKSHGPDGPTTGPVHQIVNLRYHVFRCLRQPLRRTQGCRRAWARVRRRRGRGGRRQRRDRSMEREGPLRREKQRKTRCCVSSNESHGSPGSDRRGGRK